MNLHEHQAKQILKKYGAAVPEGVFALGVDELIEKAKGLKTVTSRWPSGVRSNPEFVMPTMK